MKESLSGFSFERDSWPSVARSWTLAMEEKEFAWQSIGYCFTDLVNDTLCATYTLIVDHKIVLRFWRVDIYWPIRFVFYYFILEPKYFLLIDFRSYFSRMFLSMFLLLILRLEKMCIPYSYPDLHQWLDPTPATTIQQQRLFAECYPDLWFAIVKFSLSRQHPCFVILALPSSLPITFFFKSLQDQYIYQPLQQTKHQAMNTHTLTHTHTYIYIYTYIYSPEQYSTAFGFRVFPSPVLVAFLK